MSQRSVTIAVIAIAALALLCGVWWLWWRLPKRQIDSLAMKIRDPKAAAPGKGIDVETVSQYCGVSPTLVRKHYRHEAEGTCSEP